MQSAKHVAMIMDGNRRFAKKQGLVPWKGHEAGAEKVREVIEWCLDCGVTELTLYTLSVQNLSRAHDEVEQLMRIFRVFAKETMQKLAEVAEKGVRVRFVGNLSLLPEDLQALLREVMDCTASSDRLTVNFCVAYGGHDELVHAAKELATQVRAGSLSVDEIDSSSVSEHLWLRSEPDLVVRTGGEMRTSNFLPWQTWYSEWFFTKTFWPAFSREEFDDVLAAFSSRNRRFGR